ncbi:hypothetical protein AB0L10_45390, partial [Streptomyces flaveolus]|uniref:hypothetical protein n=1 Tax=Streptomyces flaveolus TaxID=67297 RepID=UPI0034322F70
LVVLDAVPPGGGTASGEASEKGAGPCGPAPVWWLHVSGAASGVRMRPPGVWWRVVGQSGW